MVGVAGIVGSDDLDTAPPRLGHQQILILPISSHKAAPYRPCIAKWPLVIIFWGNRKAFNSGNGSPIAPFKDIQLLYEIDPSG